MKLYALRYKPNNRILGFDYNISGWYEVEEKENPSQYVILRASYVEMALECAAELGIKSPVVRKETGQFEKLNRPENALLIGDAIDGKLK